MDRITRTVNGARVTFLDGALTTSIDLSDSVPITGDSTVQVRAESVLLHDYASAEAQRDLRALAGPIVSVWRMARQTQCPERWVVRFTKPEHALLAVQKYTCRIKTELLYTMSVYAPKSVTNVIRACLDRILKMRGAGHELSFKYEWSLKKDDGEKTALTIWDVNRTHLAEVKRAVICLYRGQVARHTSATLNAADTIRRDYFESFFTSPSPRSGTIRAEIWHPFFELSQGEAWLQQLSSQMDVLILADNAQHCIRVYGLWGRRELWSSIQIQLTRQYTAIASQRRPYTYRVKRSRETAEQVLSGKHFLSKNSDIVRQMRDHIELVSDLESRVLDLTRTASQARDTWITCGLPASTFDDAVARGPQQCPICLDSTTTIRLTCGHAYCSDCFNDQVHTATHDITTSDFPLRCWADGCGKSMSLLDLQLHLSNEQFNALLTASLRVAVRSRPAVFRNCPRVDCTGMFLRNRGTVHTCPECLTLTCPSCARHAHPNFPCGGVALRRRIAPPDPSGSYLIHTPTHYIVTKECPKCQVPVQKEDGCNHVHCICQADWCWMCRAVFAGSTEEGRWKSGATKCYEHLRRVHGGIRTYCEEIVVPPKDGTAAPGTK